MTQTAERPASVPLTNPVPGAWIQLADRDMPPVYVPFEPQTRKHETTGKDEVIGHAPGAHIKRLLSEGAMYATGPAGSIPVAAHPSAEEALRTELEQTKAAHERLLEELAELRAKIASDPGVPNAPKRR